ncbi:MAG: putative homoserine dehydrogenase-like protein, partial [Cryomorphaceae bacterium]
MKQKVGIIGRGVVGRALIDQIEKLNGFDVHGVAVKNESKHRDLPKKWRVKDPFELIDADEVDTILEAINNGEDSLSYAVNSLEKGKTYITA